MSDLFSAFAALLHPPAMVREAEQPAPEQDQERAYLEACKGRVIDELSIAVVDHEGRRINGRKWKWLKGMVRSL